MTTIPTTKRPPATRARDDKTYARRGDVDEDVDEALARARDEAAETGVPEFIIDSSSSTDRRRAGRARARTRARFGR